MLIHKNFVGGNICIQKRDIHNFYLNSELRDSAEEWFYWAFCVENAAEQSITFHFPAIRLGYFGPAVSHDLKEWKWLGKGDDENAFTYTFERNENKVYFAHSMLYHPDRFYGFANKNGLKILELCKSPKGRSVPYIMFGEGKRVILLTARHHCCESSGSYVLEGVLEGFLKRAVPDTRVICIPFVDFDGVVDGDQGKLRLPHDHNRDYIPNAESIYPEVKAIRKIADGGILYGFDFHSPWHFHAQNDTVFIIQKEKSKSSEYAKFGSIFENSITESALQYKKSNDIPPGEDWNSPKTDCFSVYMNGIAKAKLAFTLETTYFGTAENIFTQENSVELGRCFADAVRKYDTMSE